MDENTILLEETEPVTTEISLQNVEDGLLSINNNINKINNNLLFIQVMLALIISFLLVRDLFKRN